VNTLIAVALAGMAGLGWFWLADGTPMPYWVMVAFVLGSSLGADLAERALEWRRARRRPAPRRAHARTTPDRTRKNGVPL